MGEKSIIAQLINEFIAGFSTNHLQTANKIFVLKTSIEIHKDAV